MEQFPSDSPQPMTANLQRTAWAIMLVSVLMFCGLCAATVYGFYTFLFESTVPMTAIAQASRNSIGITGLDLREDTERGARALPLNNVVRPTDPDAQGVIVIQDPALDNLFVASLTLIGDSTASLRAALRPRFDLASRFGLGARGYRVEATRATGRLEVMIAKDLPSGLEFELTTEQRVRIVMTGAGWYSIVVTGDAVSVESHGGTALIYGPDKSFGYSVTAGNGSTYSIANDELRAQQPVVNMLFNSDFRDSFVPVNSDVPLPRNWACGLSVNPPRGAFSVERQDGRDMLHVSRGDGATTPGVISCTQGGAPEEAWADISTATALSIRASIQLNFQSLAVCGFEGTECPVMIRLDYIDARGNPGALIYGFYAVPGPADPYDTTCPNCRQQHIRLQENVWYTFDSGNILGGFEPGQRPVAISRLQFYASGHQYDVRIGRMELITDG